MNVDQVSVKEKQLMQKFFIAPKETGAVKPQVVCEFEFVLHLRYSWQFTFGFSNLKGSPLETFEKFDFTWSNLWKNVVYVILKIIIVSMIARIKL